MLSRKPPSVQPLFMCPVGCDRICLPGAVLYLFLGASSKIHSHPIIGTILHRVWCSGNIVDSHFSEVTALSTAPGSTPGIRVTISFYIFFIAFSSLVLAKMHYSHSCFSFLLSVYVICNTLFLICRAQVPSFFFVVDFPAFPYGLRP